MNTQIHKQWPRLVCGLLLGTGLASARADYAATVLSYGPVAYWRLNDQAQVPAPDLAKNSGSLGATVDGYYVGTAYHPVPGALTSGTDTAVSFDAVAGTGVSIPYAAALNPKAPFTVEAWLNPQAENAAGTLTCALSSGQFADPRSGWLLYQSDTGWNFRMYNQNALNTSVNITGGPAPAVGLWHHIVAVYDGTNALVYVNGVQAASGAPTGYVPSAGGRMFLGARSDASFWWNGFADEVAVYGKALTATEIAAHYQNGTSASPATPYSQLVLGGSPLAYYRLNEPAYVPPTTVPVAKNAGTGGAAYHGSYQPGMDGQAAGPRPPTFSGFEANNTAGGFNGLAGYVGTTAQTLFDVPTFTMIGWFRPNGPQANRTGLFGQNDVVENGWHDAATQFGPWSANGGFPVASPSLISPQKWHFFAAVADGTTFKVLLNGVEAASVASSPASFGTAAYNFNIGGGGILDASGNTFNGQIDEVAVFQKPLTMMELQAIYFAANIAPVITTQPAAPARDLFEGNAVTLSVAASGTPPLTYQWRKGGADLPGKTAADLAFASVMLADAGTYDVVVRNPYGSVTSSNVTLTVKPGDQVPPTLQYAAGKRSFTGVRIWFSEPLDPASAQTSANYQISGGVTVTSAALVAPAGSPGDNMVDLVTSAQTPGQTYTLTVNGVKDQASPANAIAANSTVSFSSWVFVPGLMFEHYDNITGAGDSDITRGLQDPRVIAGTPTTLGIITGAFNTRSVFPNDSHEYYLARITGYLTPTVTGDYHFFLRSDDASRLYLSPNDKLPDPATDTPICAEPGCCGGFYEPWDGDPATTVNPIRLVAGQRYGVLALLKEHAGGDWLMVAWRTATDPTPAADLPYLPGQFLSTSVDPNAEVKFTQQPTDQVGTLPSTGLAIVTETFNSSDGGFTVENTTDKVPAGPFLYDPAAGQWVADGSTDGCDGPYNSRLSSPAYTLAQDGTVSLVFSHRYSFEGDLWDAGLVRLSVNGGAFAQVPADNFSAHGYAPGNIQGNGIANGLRAFNGDSPGYDNGQFVTSKALLGTFRKGDKLVVQFVGAWDDCASAKHPSWVIDSLGLELLPMLIQDFATTNGGYTVQNSGTPPANWGPWTYNAAAGKWAAAGSDTECGGPWNSKLTSPAYVVPQSDEVTLSFSHRYRLEGDYYDGGQVWISVNGGAFAPVSPDNFTANGYAPSPIVGNGILNGQRAFNGDSPGFANGDFITSSVILGTFAQGDTIAVQFVGGWDDCWSPGQPGWEVKTVQLVFGKAAKAVTFEAVAGVTRQGTPVPFGYQWQRDDGAGFVDISGATGSTFRIYPTAADFQARFRAVASTPGKSGTSNAARIVTAVLTPPEISAAIVAGKITLQFTGTLQSATQVSGPYTDVAGAQSPYVVASPGALSFFRSKK